MGVRGPIPKPAEERVRRNKPPEKTSLEPRRGPAPDLGFVDASESTVEWWATVWASPMASAWLPSDVPVLRRLAVLLEAVMVEPKMGLLQEIRHLEDRFGLSPLARTRLQWEPEREVSAVQPGEAARAQSDRWLRSA